MSIHVAEPLALLLLVLLVPVAQWARRSIAGLGRARGVAALSLRAAIVILLVLSLARLQWSFTQDELSVIYVLDQSQSIPEASRRGALDFVVNSQASRPRGDRVGLVVFGRKAALERRARDAPLLTPETEDAREAPTPAAEIASLQSIISPERTNIAGALRLALAALPPSSRKRIVLVSDGNENLGAAAEEAAAANRQGVRIDVRPVEYAYQNEVMVEKVVAPAECEVGATFEVRTVVNALDGQRAHLRLYENGVLLGSETVDLKTGRNVFVVQRALPEPGYYDYRATIESADPADDTLPANNTASAFSIVRGEGRVLYVEGDPAHGGGLRDALAAQGLNVKLAGAEVLPLDKGQLIAYDTLILSNIPAYAIGREGMREIELAVKEWGVGLVVIGGPEAYGPGGYQQTPLEACLPVSCEVKDRRVLPSGALVIILHTCEIPRGNYWARQITLAALKVLSSTDEFGVIYYSFTGGEKWLFELKRVQDKAAMAKAIEGVSPGDMPDYLPPFVMAHTALKASTASVKHVVVISDGDAAYASDDTVKAMVADGITISTVCIAPHSQNDLVRMAHVANLGRGRCYEPTSASALPMIFTKEAATVRRSLIFEEAFRPRGGLVSQISRGIDPDEYPPLLGYVVTTPKALAETPLLTHQEDPLLAHWRYGLGNTVAFTSDAKPRWAANWIPWSKYAQFWAQVVRFCARNVQRGDLRVATQSTEDRAHVLIDAVDPQGRFLNNMAFEGVVISPGNEEAALLVQQTGPGRYEAHFDAADAGTHYVILRYTGEDGRPRLHTQGLVVPYPAEYRELRANRRFLESLAEATGGRVLAEDDDVFARTFPPVPRREDRWPLLLLAAVALVPADIFVRRVFVDYGALWRRARAAAERLPFLPGAHPPAEAPSYVSPLLTVKQQTREELATRTRKFEVTGPVELSEPTLEPTREGAPPRVAPRQTPAATPAGPAIERDDETYTGRLLRAKRRFRQSTDEPTDQLKDADSPDSRTEE